LPDTGGFVSECFGVGTKGTLLNNVFTAGLLSLADEPTRLLYQLNSDSMSRFSDPLVIGKGYDRKELAQLWDLAGFQAIGRGVFTPKGSGQIFLFVTRERLGWMTPYKNFLDGDLLFWDGEKGHGSDDRIASASRHGEEIHLLYRDQRHTPFIYHGKVVMVRCSRFTHRPSEFVFNVVGRAAEFASTESMQLAEEPADYAVISEAGMNSIDRAVTARSRGIAQRLFRGNLLRLWRGASTKG
jgi:hypothetical protein